MLDTGSVKWQCDDSLEVLYIGSLCTYLAIIRRGKIFKGTKREFWSFKHINSFTHVIKRLYILWWNWDEKKKQKSRRITTHEMYFPFGVKYFPTSNTKTHRNSSRLQFSSIADAVKYIFQTRESSSLTSHSNE